MKLLLAPGTSYTLEVEKNIWQHKHLVPPVVLADALILYAPFFDAHVARAAIHARVGKLGRDHR